MMHSAEAARLYSEFSTPIITTAALIPGSSFGNVDGVRELSAVDAGASAFVVDFEHCMEGTGVYQHHELAHFIKKLI